MEDSSQFMQWALSTLQHEHPPATPAAAYDDGGDTFSSVPALGYSASLNSMVPGEPPAREGRRAANSWSSGDTDSGSGGGSASVTAMERDGWSPSQNSVRCAAPPPSSGCSGTSQPVSWNINSASAQPIKEALPNSAAAARAEGGGGGVPLMVQHRSTPTRRASMKSSGSSSLAPYAQDHIIAERKRREKINQRFIELSTVIPGLKKMDKATILSDATRYVKMLQEKIRALEDGSINGRGIGSAVLVKKPRITVADDEDGRPPSSASGVPLVASGARNALPEIEARVSEGNVMVRIHCDDTKGMLVRLLAEVEGLHLSITNTSVMPFQAHTLIINIVAKVEESFNSRADDIAGRLNSVLNQNDRNSTEETRSCC